MGSHQRLNYIHIFRALAIIIIVAGHCFQSVHPVFGSLLHVLLQDGTVLFVFIAGFLFQYLSDNFSYKPYLKKKFFNVVAPYLITSVLGIAAVLFLPKTDPFAGINKIVQVFMFLTTGYVHNLPTWYIPMTCIFFLFASILLKMRDKIIFQKYSLLFFLLPFLITFSCLMPRHDVNWFVTEGMSAWEKYGGYMEKTLFNTILFFPAYILGMYFASARENIAKLYEKRYWLLGFFVGFCMVSFYLIYGEILPGRLLLPKVVLTLLILGYLEHYDEKIMQYPRLNDVLGTVATYSFSIFFLHYYFIMGLRPVFRRLFPMHSVYLSAENFQFGYWFVYTGILFIFAFFGSLLVAMATKKILTKMGVKNTRFFIGA